MSSGSHQPLGIHRRSCDPQLFTPARELTFAGARDQQHQLNLFKLNYRYPGRGVTTRSFWWYRLLILASIPGLKGRGTLILNVIFIFRVTRFICFIFIEDAWERFNIHTLFHCVSQGWSRDSDIVPLVNKDELKPVSRKFNMKMWSTLPVTSKQPWCV